MSVVTLPIKFIFSGLVGSLRVNTPVIDLLGDSSPCYTCRPSKVCSRGSLKKKRSYFNKEKDKRRGVGEKTLSKDVHMYVKFVPERSHLYIRAPLDQLSE